MALWRLYYHIVWATKERHPLILPDQESQLYNYIIGKSNQFNSIVHEVNGMTDHIHLIGLVNNDKFMKTLEVAFKVIPTKVKEKDTLVNLWLGIDEIKAKVTYQQGELF